MANDSEEEIPLVVVLKDEQRFDPIDFIGHLDPPEQRPFDLITSSGQHTDQATEGDDIEPSYDNKGKIRSHHGIKLLQEDPRNESQTFELMKLKPECTSAKIKEQMEPFLMEVVDKVPFWKTRSCSKGVVFLIDGGIDLHNDHIIVLQEVLEMSDYYPGWGIVNGLAVTDILYPSNHIICVESSSNTSNLDGLDKYGLAYLAGPADGSGVHDGIRYVLILENATARDVMRYRLAIQSIFFNKYISPCLKILIRGSKDIIMSISSGEYFKEDIPTLVINDGTDFSKSLSEFLKSLMNGSETESCKRMLAEACAQCEVEESIEVDKFIDELKDNIWKITVCDMPKRENASELFVNIVVAMSKGINPSISFVMDVSQQIVTALTSDHRYKKNSNVLFFNCLSHPEPLEYFLSMCKEYDGYSTLEKHFEVNKGKIFSMQNEFNLHDKEHNATAQMLYGIVEDRLQRDVLETYLRPFVSYEKYFGNALLKDCPLLGVMKALFANDVDLMVHLLNSHAVDVYPYIYFVLSNHWTDAPERTDNKVINHFKILNKYRQATGKRINKAISTLCNGLTAELFHENAEPNIQVITLVQALIVNRLFCMQLDFVKALWWFDKANSFVNALLIWILVKGMLKEGIFGTDNSVDDLLSLKKYFEDKTGNMLDIAQDDYSCYSILVYRCPIFRNAQLISIAGEVNYDAFLIHTVARRLLAYVWTEPYHTPEFNGSTYEIRTIILSPRTRLYMQPVRYTLLSPRNKLYAHMVMYLVCYLTVATCALRAKTKESPILRWITFLLITSLAVDELRQAFGDNGRIVTSLKAWWSDPWNKIDVFSMLLYYVAFSLDLTGVPESRIVLAAFSFVWCLKFYQFLRAFQSVGTYIIMVQKMLPHLWNFSLVALVALIGYGVFITSTLFPSNNFESWSSLLLILIRPYLLLYAETGINDYGLSKTSTLFNTPKVPDASEMLAIIGMCVFLMFGSILLINLLIAIFSGVYDEVKERSEKLWVVNDFQLLKEFQTKPSLPIPLSVAQNLVKIVERFRRRVVGSKKDPYGSFDMKIPQVIWSRKLSEQEEDNVASLEELKKKVAKDFDKRLHERTADLEKQLQERTADLVRQLKEETANLQEQLQERTADLERQLKEETANLQEQLMERTGFLEKQLNGQTADLGEQLMILTKQNKEIQSMLSELSSRLR